MKRVATLLILLLSVCWADVAEAKPKRWVLTTATVGGQLWDRLSAAQLAAMFLPRLIRIKPREVLLWIQSIFFGLPMGAAIGGSAGAVAGHALAGGERVGHVALATGVTGVSSFGLLGLAPVSGPAIAPMWATGATGAVVGVPVAAGMATHEKKERRVRVAVSPSFTPKYKGLALSARFGKAHLTAAALVPAVVCRPIYG